MNIDSPAKMAAYAAAIRSLTEHAFAGVSCLHGISLIADCNECEPCLDHELAFAEGAAV